MLKQLLTPEELFDLFFKKWYNRDLDKIGVKPDMMSFAQPGTDIFDLKLLTDDGVEAISKHVNIMIKAAADDWKNFLNAWKF